MSEPPVVQLRVVLTVADLDRALAQFRDALGLRVEAEHAAEGRRVVILGAGRATLELSDDGNAAFVDEVEVGTRSAGPVRLAFEVADAGRATERLLAAGAAEVAPPTRTPWGSVNARVVVAAEPQVTVFEALGPETMA